MSELTASPNASIFRDGDSAPKTLIELFALAAERANGSVDEEIVQNAELLRIQATAIDAALANAKDPLEGLPEDPAQWSEADLNKALLAHGFPEASSIASYRVGSALSLAMRMPGALGAPVSFCKEWSERATARAGKKSRGDNTVAARKTPRPDGAELDAEERELADGLDRTLTARISPVPGALAEPWPEALLRRAEMSAEQLDALLFHANACDWLLIKPAALPPQAAKYGADGLWGAVAKSLSASSGAPIESIKKIARLMSDDSKFAESWRAKCYYVGTKWRANFAAGGIETRSAQKWIQNESLPCLVPASHLAPPRPTMKIQPEGLTATQHKQFERAMEAINDHALQNWRANDPREDAWLCAQALSGLRDWVAKLGLSAGSAAALGRVSALGWLDGDETQASVKQALGAVALSDSFVSPSGSSMATNLSATQKILSSFIEPAARALGLPNASALVERSSAALSQISEGIVAATGEWLALEGELAGAPALGLPAERIALRKEGDGQWSAWSLDEAAWSESDKQWTLSGKALPAQAPRVPREFNPFGSRRMEWPDAIAKAIHAAQLEKRGNAAERDLSRRVSSASQVAAEWLAQSDQSSVGRWVAAARICALSALSINEHERSSGPTYKDMGVWLQGQQRLERVGAAKPSATNGEAAEAGVAVSPAQAAFDLVRAVANPAQWDRKIKDGRSLQTSKILMEGEAAGFGLCFDWDARIEAAAGAAEARAGAFFEKHGSINILAAHRKLAAQRIQPETLDGLMETARSGATAVQLIDERPAFHRLCLVMAKKLGVPTTLGAPGQVKAIVEAQFGFGPGAWKMMSKAGEPAAEVFAHMAEKGPEINGRGQGALSQIGHVLSVLASANVDGPALLDRLLGDATPEGGNARATPTWDAARRITTLSALLTDEMPERPIRGLAAAQQYVAECQARAARIPELARALSAMVAKQPTAQDAAARLDEVRDFFDKSEVGVWQELPEKIGDKSLMRRVQDWHRLLAHKKTQESLEKTVATIRAGLGQSIRQGDCASVEEGMASAQKGAWPFSLARHEEKVGDCVWTAVALNTAGALFEEGRAMSHCVSSYASDCAAGSSRIYSIQKNGARVSTMQLQAEFDGQTAAFKGWRDIQNRGAHNAAIVFSAVEFCRSVAKAATEASQANIERARLAEFGGKAGPGAQKGTAAAENDAESLEGLSRIGGALAAARERRGAQPAAEPVEADAARQRIRGG